MRLTDVTLRTESCGVYYKGTWGCDSVLAEKIRSYGVAVSLQAMPDEDFATAEGCLYSCYDGGELKNGEVKTGILIKNIMKESTPKVTLDVLRERLGYKTISGVSDRLSRGKSMKVDNYVQFLDALGYELIVQPKTARDPKEGSYKVGVEE